MAHEYEKSEGKGFKERADRLLGEGTHAAFRSYKKSHEKALSKMVGKGNVLKGKNIEGKKEKTKYTGKKGEYSKVKQGNWMKVHPLDRI